MNAWERQAAKAGVLATAEDAAPIADLATRFSLWLNSTYPPDLHEETVFWRRVGKISEEAGEVREASGAYWLENPRKPKGPIEDVIAELADCVGAALGAIEHLTGHQGRSLDIATDRVRYVCERVGVPTGVTAYPRPAGPESPADSRRFWLNHWFDGGPAGEAAEFTPNIPLSTEDTGGSR